MPMTRPLSFVHEAGVIVPKVTRVPAASGAGVTADRRMFMFPPIPVCPLSWFPDGDGRFRRHGDSNQGAVGTALSVLQQTMQSWESFLRLQKYQRLFSRGFCCPPIAA